LKDKQFKHFNPMALREKYSAGSKKQSNPFSSFWADNSWDTRRSSFIDELEEAPKGRKPVDHVKLASYRRAIANFVTIVTNRSDIPVQFQSNDSSYTDGKKVMIGSKIDEKNFDPVVGLALHEGSHIKLSDFDFLRNLENNIPQETFIHAEKVGIDKWTVLTHMKNLLNYVEDRRIDHYIFSNSPGYKGYYHSMYEKYFHSKIIDKALQTDEFTSIDWDSYIFRILNLTNKNRNLNALPGLKEIFNMVFIAGGGVKRMKSTEHCFITASGIYDVILNNLPELKMDKDGNIEKPQDMKGNDSAGEGEGTGSPSEGGESPDDSMSDEEFDSMIDGVENGEGNVTPGSGSGTGKEVKLSEKQMKQLENAIQKQKDFVNGETKKVGKLTKKDSASVKAMEEAGVEKIQAGESMTTEEWNYDTQEYDTIPGKGVGVIYVKKLTQTMIDENLFPSILRRKSSYYYNSDRDSEIMSQGISLGTKLGRKLQIRGESRDLKSTRLDSGRIDKRLISELGFGNERVFQTTFTESYSDAFLHISVDASGSMGGEKWRQTMISTIAICKAVDMIQNVDVMVSFRSTHEGGHRRNRDMSSPLILIGYDSRVDKFSKVKKMFPCIYPGGTTPEGLCFEAILKDIVPTTNNRESYFLNLSDGMPMFSNNDVDYYNKTAINHTKKMVDEIRKQGIKVMSYFVSDTNYDRSENLRDFKRMYGKDAEMIDLSSVLQISKTMNKKFLEKN
jgi:hypothetical protein